MSPALAGGFFNTITTREAHQVYIYMCVCVYIYVYMCVYIYIFYIVFHYRLL